MDSALIRRIQSGDADAFAQLFESHKNLVFRTAFLILNSSDEADDILQDVFIQVHHSLSTYDPSKSAFSTWLYRITVNKCLNRKRHWTFFVPFLEDIPERELPSTTGFDGQLAEIESVRQSISRLSVKLRAVVILRFYWELSYAEISEILELPLGTIKSRINLALITLQTSLKDEFDSAKFTIKEQPK